MSWFSSAVRSVNNFIAKVDPIAKNLPEFQSVKKAFEAGNWDRPFGSEASGWDFLGAGAPGQITSGGKTVGGALDPEKPKDRAIGRTVGTAFADAWTFGAFSALMPKGDDMKLETGNGMTLETGNGIAFNSLTSPGALSATQGFTSEPSSVTPRQAAQVANAESIKRWAWYAVGAIALLLFFKKGFFK